MTDKTDTISATHSRRSGLFIGIALFALLLIIPTPEGMSRSAQSMAAV